MAGKFENLEIKGLDEIERRLQQLPEKLRRKSIRKVMTESAEIIRSEAARRCRRNPKGPTWRKSGHLADAIARKVTVRAEASTAKIGIDYTKAHHGHLVEFGHRVVVHKKDTGKRTRKFPFMRPAFDGQGDRALEVLLDGLKKAVEAEA